jgi:anti-anti-sigma factor
MAGMDASQPARSGLAALAVAVHTQAAAVIAEVRGEIDMGTAATLEERLLAELEAAPAVLVVDLTDVTFLASAGLAVLVRCHQYPGPTSLRVVAGPSTARPIELTGLDHEISVFPTRAAALAN